MNLRELQRKANAKLRTFLRTSSKEWSLYKKNPIKQIQLHNLKQKRNTLKMALKRTRKEERKKERRKKNERKED